MDTAERCEQEHLNETINWMDCNRPGIVYVGPRSIMLEWDEEHGCCNVQIPSRSVHDDEGWWPVRFYHEADGQFHDEPEK